MPFSKSLRTLLALAFALLVLASALCMAQTESAVVSGRVTDGAGSVITGAEVLLQSVERGTTMATKTNEAGIYNFPSVHPGVYIITVRKESYLQVDFVGLTANVQAHVDQNFRLQLGATSESVTFRGNIATINTESAAVSTVVDSQFVEDIPLNGRSIQTLLMLTPGVVLLPPGGSNSQGQFSVNGMRRDANYFTVDGVPANVGTNGGSGATREWLP